MSRGCSGLLFIDYSQQKGWYLCLFNYRFLPECWLENAALMKRSYWGLILRKRCQNCLCKLSARLKDWRSWCLLWKNHSICLTTFLQPTQMTFNCALLWGRNLNFFNIFLFPIFSASQLKSTKSSWSKGRRSSNLMQKQPQRLKPKSQRAKRNNSIHHFLVPIYSHLYMNTVILSTVYTVCESDRS